jgi:hypothetical protein
MLAFARRQSYEPGTNLQGEQAENVWLFLLPQLSLERVVFVGKSTSGTRIGCEALAAHVRDTAADELAEAVSGGCDLVWIAPGALPAMLADRNAVMALDAVLLGGGSVYLEPSGQTPRPATQLGELLGVSASVEFGMSHAQVGGEADERARRAAWLVPRARPPKSMLSRQLARAVRRVAPGSGSAPTGERLLAVSRVFEGMTETSRDHGVLLRSEGAALGPPEYIRRIAGEFGYELDGTRWSVTLQRGYRSQKVVFHFPELGQIVKVTQDARFNHRLANEYEALRVLETRQLADPSVVPRALYSALHGRVLVVGESRLDGAPFRERSTGSPTCPHASAVINALIDLSGAGAGADGRREAADALATLLKRHDEVHRPPAAHIGFLERQIARLAEAESAIRPVFLHGDLTTLNVLVDGEQIRLVDWENAEPAGLPLWDVVHFVGAYAAWAAERAGRRWTARSAQETLLEPSPFHAMLARAVTRYRAATALPAQAVTPLVFTWWMVMALREATRRPSGAANEGLYARLLFRAVDAGETPGLAQLAGTQ